MMVMLIGFGALAIDIGYLLVVRNELQNASDAAALTGAQCLYPRSECLNQTSPSPDWSTAEQRATAAVSLNKSSGVVLTDGQINTGYWNVKRTPYGMQALPMTPVANDAAAIQVTITRQSGMNGGPVSTFLATVLGVPSVPVSATSVAVITYPGSVGPGGLFPVAMTKCLFDNYWDSANNRPKTATSTDPLPGQTVGQTVGQPYVFRIGSSYHVGPCESGQWTTFQDVINSVQGLRDLISDGNAKGISIGDTPGTYIQPGTENALFNDVDACSAAGDKSCEYVTIPVVSTLDPKTYQVISAFACLHILSAKNGSDPYLQVQMSADTTHCETENAGGSGPAYGALTPPRLAL
ncbi:TadG family pilus assembly protein [Cupriavidus sp. Agwp_2]|uniref:TadG family pilus assembly protein n=1 Tax=Cupriavidus sp. Agwp_2 TaxID=2897324 RepID=UPI003461271F